MEGLLSITIVPMGGKMVLIKDEDFQALVKEWEDMFQQWFHSIRQ